ncbi:hypothetical protein HYT02_04815 [Candidatus Gottesmanbacteria bacterium]|nr:hypothetical protein [Candidatus Gottesmanbacteria bacterium]
MTKVKKFIILIYMVLTTLWGLTITTGVTIVITSSIIVIFNAILSAKNLGGELGKGLKKIAAGTIFYVLLILTLLAIEFNFPLGMSQTQVRIYFIFVNICGSMLLALGFLQIYTVSKKLRLF